jgi:Monooxygenase af470-like
MATRPSRQTVDLSGHPELVIIYLGMRANTLRGVATLMQTGPQIRTAVMRQPAGLLRHENIAYGLFPPHLGMRQYWRDFESMELWARTGTHARWWRDLLADPRGVSFWHETHFTDGGTEALYINMAKPIGLMSFAPVSEARKLMYSSRRRLRLPDEAKAGSPVREEDFYRD